MLAPMLLVGLGMGQTFVPLTLTAVSGVRQQETGLASALLNTGQQVGGAVGLAVLGTIASSTIKNQAGQLAIAAHGRLTHHLIDMRTASGYAHAFMAASLIALGAFVVAVLVIRAPQPTAIGSVAVEAVVGEGARGYGPAARRSRASSTLVSRAHRPPVLRAPPNRGSGRLTHVPSAHSERRRGYLSGAQGHVMLSPRRRLHSRKP